MRNDKELNELEFDIVGIEAPLANALRRILISEVDEPFRDDRPTELEEDRESTRLSSYRRVKAPIVAMDKGFRLSEGTGMANILAELEIAN